MAGKSLVILHIDGLGAGILQRALDHGRMPFTRQLMEREGYEVHRYRCGLPSTTPFVQAGILYGDNTGIPAFRWWDREQRTLIQFGAGSTFKKVADRYFKGCKPLTEDGAAIAACYPAGAADDFGIAYQDRTYGQESKSRSAMRVVVPYFINPVHLGEWAVHAGQSIWRTAAEYAQARAEGRRPARTYVLMDALEEVFAHHLTRYAVERAMGEGYAPIYAGFYAFDETSHAFGPADEHSLNILKHVDHTVRKVAEARRDRYELVVLSDHGQIETVPFRRENGRHLGELIASWMPGFRVEELKGKTFGPDEREATGVIRLTYTGGLANLYFDGGASRLAYTDVERRYPQLVRELQACPQISAVVGRGYDGGEALERAVAIADDPTLAREHVARLNSFEECGDLLMFGAFRGEKQINFENQAGGHGGFGGEQTRPLVLAKREWGLDLSGVRTAHELHPILCDLRDRLSTPRALRP